MRLPLSPSMNLVEQSPCFESRNSTLYALWQCQNLTRPWESYTPSHEEGPTTFPQFSKLPPEIRLQIWDEALPGPRVVHLKREIIVIINFGLERVRSDEAVPEHSEAAPMYWELGRQYHGREYDNFPCNSFGFRSSCPAPGLLYVCRESCQVVTQSYTRMFTTLGAVPTIWFRPSLDILFIYEHSFSGGEGWAYDKTSFNSITADDLDMVENICVHTGVLFENNHPSAEVQLQELLVFFQNAKKVTLVSKPVTHRELEENLTTDEQSTIALLPIEDYCLALARRGAKPAYIGGGMTMVDGFEMVSGVRCRDFDITAFETLRGESKDQDLPKVRVDVKAFMTEAAKQHLLRNIHLQRPTTKTEARFIAYLKEDLDFEDLPDDLLEESDEEEEDEEELFENELSGYELFEDVNLEEEPEEEVFEEEMEEGSEEDDLEGW